MKIHPVIVTIIDAGKMDPTVAGFISEAAIKAAAQSDKVYGEILATVATEQDYRAAIIRAIVGRTSGPERPEEKREEPQHSKNVQAVLGYLLEHKGEFISKSAALEGAKIPEEDRDAAWAGARVTGHLESNGKPARAAAYRYKE